MKRLLVTAVSVAFLAAGAAHAQDKTMDKGGQMIDKTETMKTQGGQTMDKAGEMKKQGGQMMDKTETMKTQGGQMIDKAGEMKKQGGQMMDQTGKKMGDTMMDKK